MYLIEAVDVTELRKQLVFPVQFFYTITFANLQWMCNEFAFWKYMLEERRKKRKKNNQHPQTSGYLSVLPCLMFPLSVRSIEDSLPKGICYFYLVRRVFFPFAFWNCLAAQACFMCAVWNVSWSHVTAVLWLMLDLLQQIWIMLKLVVSWRGYVNNSQMGIFCALQQGKAGSVWQELVFGRSIIPSLKDTLLLTTVLAWQLLA